MKIKDINKKEDIDHKDVLAAARRVTGQKAKESDKQEPKVESKPPQSF